MVDWNITNNAYIRLIIDEWAKLITIIPFHANL
jgi:hypothetical protein